MFILDRANLFDCFWAKNDINRHYKVTNGLHHEYKHEPGHLMETLGNAFCLNIYHFFQYWVYER